MAQLVEHVALSSTTGITKAWGEEDDCCGS
jgi:hypothetical protein